MVRMVFRDVFDHHEQYSAFSYGQLPETSCKILSLLCYSLVFVFTVTYLPVFDPAADHAARGSCNSLFIRLWNVI